MTAGVGTPDHQRISEILSVMDAMSIMGMDLGDQTEGIVDPEALLAAALTRSDQVVTELKLPDALHRVLTAQFMNAFVAGVRFQREGGHRDGAVGD